MSEVPLYTRNSPEATAVPSAPGASTPTLPPAVERIWHVQDSHIQILAVAFVCKSLTRFKVVRPRSEAVGVTHIEGLGD